MVGASPKSLLVLSLQQVAFNFRCPVQSVGEKRKGKSLLRRKMRQFFGKRHGLTSRVPIRCRPCDFLPEEIVQLIFHQVVELRMLRPEEMYFFLGRHQTHVDLSFVDGPIDDLLFDLPRHCSVVYTMNLSFQSIPDSYFDRLLPKLRQLSHLDLSYTCCNGTHLKQLANSGVQLRSLNIQGCSKIDDDGLSDLCQNQIQLGELNLLNTFAYGVNFLRYAHHIKRLLYEYFLCNLIKLYHASSWNFINSNLLLKYYNRDVIHVCKSECNAHAHADIDIVMDLCPHTVRLNFSWGIATYNVAAIMESITNMTDLKELYIEASYRSTNPLVFTSDLSPVLRIRGSQLTHLSLSQVRNVSILGMAQLCPNITHLQLTWCRLSPTEQVHFVHNGEGFKKLETVIIEQVPIGLFQDWGCLLFSPTLKRITIDSTLIHDDVFDDTVHHLSAVEYMAVLNCKWITRQGVTKLIAMLNNAVLFLSNCNYDLPVDNPTLQQMAIGRNVELKLR